MNKPIPISFARDVCKLGRMEKCCRYLAVGAKGFTCLKGNTILKAELDERVRENTINARGDNCVGWELRSESEANP